MLAADQPMGDRGPAVNKLRGSASRNAPRCTKCKGGLRPALCYWFMGKGFEWAQKRVPKSGGLSWPPRCIAACQCVPTTMGTEHWDFSLVCLASRQNARLGTGARPITGLPIPADGGRTIQVA